MSDPGVVESYRVALARRGVLVTVQRITGVAPNATTQSVQVVAMVTGYAAESGENYAGEGQITRGTRQVLLLESDLAAAGFPLPLRKNDKIVLQDAPEKLNIEDADAETRRLGGAIEIVASGVR